MRSWVSPSIRNDVVAFTLHYADLAGLPISWVLARIGIRRDKFYQWRQRRNRPNLHNQAIPRHFWLQDWEKQAILDFHRAHPDEGYRRLTFMMLDQDIVAASPARQCPLGPVSSACAQYEKPEGERQGS